MLHVEHAPHLVTVLEADVLKMFKDHKFVIGNGVKMMFCVLWIAEMCPTWYMR
jgi:hypothetical protein